MKHNIIEVFFKSFSTDINYSVCLSILLTQFPLYEQNGNWLGFAVEQSNDWKHNLLNRILLPFVVDIFICTSQNVSRYTKASVLLGKKTEKLYTAMTAHYCPLRGLIGLTSIFKKKSGCFKG